MLDGSANRARILVGSTSFDPLTEREVVQRVAAALDAGQGGWILTPNVDIVRLLDSDPRVAELVNEATLVVADGTPILWAARLAGTPLPERVTGSSLIFSLSADAAMTQRSVFLLGGEPGVPDTAALGLQQRFPGLRIAGTYSPDFGFESDRHAFEHTLRTVISTQPDVVFVGLGFPKQERVIAALRDSLPRSWFVGCGAAIAMAAGATPRAPGWLGALGMEWTYRLLQEPGRLADRYLRRDLPYALALLARSAAKRATTRSAPRVR
jgi:N-acetylglucosaminyldiphosphoundecaprenol N-acetyl-beta-D-mannosaminyltransferase